ncbi:MAG: NAD(P)H-hydrate dehydratase [Oligoflexia bacterium]|nr:NAD(P)H-hydrate dehydratase [Oligoflexia bacterium]
MKLVTSAEMASLEQAAFRDGETNPRQLMELAGQRATRAILNVIGPDPMRVLILVGPGNNGGDGLVVARALSESSHHRVTVFFAQSELSELGRLMVDQLPHKIEKVYESEQIERELAQAEVIIDALFGIGLSRELSEPYTRIISELNRLTGRHVISLDVPSGLDCDRGIALGACVRARQTLTFQYAKTGFFLEDGPAHAGKIKIIPLDFSDKVIKKAKFFHFLMSRSLVRKWLEPLQTTTHKSRQGSLLVVAGSTGMWGAAHLVTEGAYRVGAGYVTLALDQKSYGKDMSPFASAEVLTTERSNLKMFEKKSACLLGPGAGVGADLRGLILKAKEVNLPTLLDADALTELSKMKLKLPSHWVLTPHVGELTRLLGKADGASISKKRLEAAKECSKKYGCIVLAKGFKTIVATPNGNTIIVPTGNAALAKAGSGDVLSGFIGGLLAQGIEPLRATLVGAYLHGYEADRWVNSGRDQRSMMPKDLLRMVPRMLSKLRGDA